jgi:UrcA family protein
MTYATGSSLVEQRSLLRITSAAVLLMLSVITRAEPAVPGQTAEARAAKVSLADLDLASAEGLRLARKRITAAAQRLCWQMGDTNRATNRATVSSCVRDTVAEAMEIVVSSGMTALKDKP